MVSAESRERRRLDEYRPVDEHANLVTHGLGFLLSVIASIVLMLLVIDDPRSRIVVSCGVYCVSLMGLYGASTLSHMFHEAAWRRLFRTLDQACIFLLIAGSFTPFGVVASPEGGWSLLLVAMWVLALFGVIMVLAMRDLTSAAKVTYLILGWLPVLTVKHLYMVFPFSVFVWLIVGGLFYSVGVIFLRFDHHVRYFHALWHTFVIAGSTAHYIAILQIVQ